MPKVKGKTDVSNFDEEFTQGEVNSMNENNMAEQKEYESIFNCFRDYFRPFKSYLLISRMDIRG